jgi:lysozyme family protein
MANFDSCVEWVLRFEDSTLSGKVVVLADGAGRTRFGITEKNHPDLSPDFFTTDAATALAEAKDIYRANEWAQLCGDALTSDAVAATLLSFAVNDGERFEARVLQRILGVTPDGAIGPVTVAAANAQDGPTLAGQLREAQAAHYRALAATNPNDQQYLGSTNPPRGWLGRAAAIYPGA